MSFRQAEGGSGRFHKLCYDKLNCGNSEIWYLTVNIRLCCFQNRRIFLLGITNKESARLLHNKDPRILGQALKTSPIDKGYGWRDFSWAESHINSFIFPLPGK